MKTVPNKFPPKPGKVRLAVIGEAPGETEEATGVPFVGKSGRLVQEFFTRAGLNLSHCFVGNVCQHRPPNNDFSQFGWDGPEVQDGLAQLTCDLKKYKPTAVLLLGANALRAALGERRSIEAMRGSPLGDAALACVPWGRMPHLPTYHPAATFREYNLRVPLYRDIQRFAFIAQHGLPEPPEERFQLDAGAGAFCDQLARLRKARARVAIDIEGYPKDLRCVAVAWSPSDAIVVAGDTLAEPRCHREFAAFLADPKVTKVFHNGLYDRFVLAWEPWGMPVEGLVEDSMLAQWELECELPKALDYCGSLHTWRPYWKSDKHAQDRLTLQCYCARDTTGTLEIFNVQEGHLSKVPASLRHYRFNTRTLSPLLNMELRGIRYDVEGARKRADNLQLLAYEKQHAFDLLTGAGITGPAVLGEALLAMCMVRHKVRDRAGITEDKVRKEWRPKLKRILELADKERTPAEQGELSTLLKLHRNVEATAFRNYLYFELRFPKQHKRTAKGPVLTADETALLRLKKAVDSPIPAAALELRNLNTRIGMLRIRADEDGRIRAGYNPVGQETGRVSCYTSPTGSGYNLTTIPEADRDLFLADEGCWLGQCDLSGADSWTVAANLASLGAPRMLNDLRAGMNPAKALVLMRDDPSLASMESEELAKLAKAVDKSKPAYFIAKKTIHGTCYLMGARTCSRSTFLESGGEIDVPEKEMAAFQALVQRRYKVSLWHGAVQRRLVAERGSFTVPSGHLRRFRNWPERRLTEALAHEPQANTTWATNTALVRCWEDPENIDKSGHRIIEPFHHIHDALLFQFPRKRLAWARKKIREWFTNTIVIAGLPIVIPFEGKYGESWGNLKEGTL